MKCFERNKDDQNKCTYSRIDTVKRAEILDKVNRIRLPRIESGKKI